jgi:hypothetical protein
MEVSHHVHLTAAEMGSLWNFYLANTMSRSMFQHFLMHIEDPDIKNCIEKSDSLSKDILTKLTTLFQEEQMPVPIGFGGKDVNLDAPRLFSDTFYLEYLSMMSKLGSIFYSITLPNMSRMDLRLLISQWITSTIDLSNLIIEVQLKKGIYVRPPFIPTAKAVEFVDKQSFFNGFFGEKRPLMGIEISQIFANIQLNSIKTALLTGFSQVAKTKDVRDFFLRGKHINMKQSKIFTSFFEKEELPSIMPNHHGITNSQKSPYSEKMMLFHVTNLSSAKARNFGDSMAVSPRHDLMATYGRFMIETGNFAEDGGNLLIEHGWMEKQPQNVDRKKLVKD